MVKCFDAVFLIENLSKDIMGVFTVPLVQIRPFLRRKATERISNILKKTALPKLSPKTSKNEQELYLILILVMVTGFERLCCGKMHSERGRPTVPHVNKHNWHRGKKKLLSVNMTQSCSISQVTILRYQWGLSR